MSWTFLSLCSRLWSQTATRLPGPRCTSTSTTRSDAFPTYCLSCPAPSVWFAHPLYPHPSPSSVVDRERRSSCLKSLCTLLLLQQCSLTTSNVTSSRPRWRRLSGWVANPTLLQIFNLLSCEATELSASFSPLQWRRKPLQHQEGRPQMRPSVTGQYLILSSCLRLSLHTVTYSPVWWLWSSGIRAHLKIQLHPVWQQTGRPTDRTTTQRRVCSPKLTRAPTVENDWSASSACEYPSPLITVEEQRSPTSVWASMSGKLSSCNEHFAEYLKHKPQYFCSLTAMLYSEQSACHVNHSVSQFVAHQ